jgi:Domain of unknown function (DUF4440)
MKWFLLAAILLVACSRTPDEQRIRETIAQMQKAVEQGAPRDFMAYVSADFIGNQGTVDRNDLANVLRVEVLRNERQTVFLGPTDVVLQDDRATARVTATLSGRSSGATMPERASVFSIVSSWRKEGATWRCYNAKWEQEL